MLSVPARQIELSSIESVNPSCALDPDSQAILDDLVVVLVGLIQLLEAVHGRFNCASPSDKYSPFSVSSRVSHWNFMHHVNER